MKPFYTVQTVRECRVHEGEVDKPIAPGSGALDDQVLCLKLRVDVPQQARFTVYVVTVHGRVNQVDAWLRAYRAFDHNLQGGFYGCLEVVVIVFDVDHLGRLGW